MCIGLDLFAAQLLVSSSQVAGTGDGHPEGVHVDALLPCPNHQSVQIVLLQTARGGCHVAAA